MPLRLVLFALSLLTACAVGPDYKRPAFDAPSDWTEGQAARDAARESPWWLDPGDPVLTDLQTRALGANLDLKLAMARIEEAKAGQRGALAGFLPAGGVAVTPSRGQLNTKASFKTSPVDNTELAFSPSWEIDVFGGVRRGVEAATADLAAAGAERAATQQMVAAEVGRTYAALRDAEMQHASIKANAKSQLDTYDIVNARFQAGLTSALAVSQAKRAYETTSAQLPLFTAERARAKHRLELLCGVKPGGLDDLLTVTATVPTPPGDLWLTNPRTVLALRPDILAAERRLAAATARIGVAKADFFPKISLWALLGARSTTPETLLLASGGFWQYGARGALAILDFPRIQANVRAADARTQEALAAYEKTLLQALSEVETTLSAYAQQIMRRDELAAAELTAKDAVELARERFVRGIANFLDVLDGERELTRIQTELVQARAAVFSRYVDLQAALGATAAAPEGSTRTGDDSAPAMPAPVPAPAPAPTPESAPAPQAPKASAPPTQGLSPDRTPVPFEPGPAPEPVRTRPKAAAPDPAEETPRPRAAPSPVVASAPAPAPAPAPTPESAPVPALAPAPVSALTPAPVSAPVTATQAPKPPPHELSPDRTPVPFEP